ncbi:MAG TPA: PIN domain-containing protein [Thermoanaerobaculia bacterium]|jgi:predicted nucleic acid-binding protein|nr:PIN domain-containing protein [Thermoanaerobaculia bacterium]
MSLLLLDTNTLSYILKNVPPVPARLEDAVRQGKSFLLASIAHYELTRYLHLKGAHRLLRIYQQLTTSWQPCEPSFEDWDEAARVWAERHRSGQGISDPDLLLAVLARKRNATLVTTNTRHFTGLGLALEDWTT